MIHEYQAVVFFTCLVLLPCLIYLIKIIPLRYSTFSADTIEQLDLYEYQLSRLKQAYQELSREMNNAALAKTATRQVEDRANEVIDNLMGSLGGLSGISHSAGLR